MVFNVQRENRRGIEVVHRNIKKPLNLRCVQIKGQDALNAGFGNQVRNKFGRNGRAGFGATVLAGISEVGNNRRDAFSRGAAQGVGDDQKFHQIVVCRVRRGLDNEHILTAYVLVNFDPDFAVVEAFDTGVCQFDRNPLMNRHALGDGFGQRFIRVTGD